MARKYLQTKKSYLSYSISDTQTSIQLDFLQKLDGTSITASDVGDLMYGTIDPGTSKEEIFSVTSSDVTVNASGTVSLVIVRGLQEISPYSTGGFKTFHGAGAIVVFSNNPQLYAQFGNIYNTNTWSLVQTFTLLPVSNGGNATDNTQLVTYAQAVAMATGTTAINRVVVAGTGGETLVAGNLVYLKESDGRWWKCDADIAATVDNIILGIAQGASTAGTAVTSGVLLFGLDSNQTGLTANSIGYAGNTAGAIVSTTPGTVEVTVGYSTSTTTILFYPRYNQQITEDIQDALVGNNGTPSATNKYSTQTGLQRAQEIYAADAQASDTYVVTLSPVPAAYVTGMEVNFKANTVNTGAATLNVNGLGAITIVKGVSTTLENGDILALQQVKVRYDGTNFVLMNPVATNVPISAIPKLMFSTLFETAGRFTTTVTNTGSGTFGTSGVALTAGGGVNGSINVVGDINNAIGDVFAGSPAFGCILIIGDQDTMGGTGHSFFGIGAVTVATTGITYTPRHIGFKFIKTGGVMSLYATQADGTTENASAVLTTVAQGDSLDLLFRVNATGSVDYYWRKNGGALSSATNLTINLPSGTITTLQVCASSVSTASANTIGVRGMSYER